MKSEYKIVAGIGVVMCLLVILISYPIAKVVMDDKERLAYGIKRIVEEEEIECKAVFVSGDLHNQLNQLGLEPVMTYRKKDARKVLELRVESVFTGDDFEGIKIVEEEDRYILTYPKENNMLDYQNIKMESMEIPKASKEDKIKITQLFEGGMGDVE